MKPPELELPEVEEKILYILEWFYEIKSGEPITYLEIEAWNRLKSIGISADEVEGIMAMDLEFLKSQNGN